MKGPEPRRSSPRHPHFDYRTEAAYFVTINTYRRRPLFGTIADRIVHPTCAGEIVAEEWLRSEELRETVVLDAFVVMPDHFHGIVCIVPPGVTEVSPRGYSLTVPSHNAVSSHCSATIRHRRFRDGRPYRSPRSLSSLIACFKAAVTRRVREKLDSPADTRVWQRRFHDRILRNEREWRIRRNYIARNPERWWEKYGDR